MSENQVATLEQKGNVVCKNVLSKATKMQEAKVLSLPATYAVGNAIKGAEFALMELKNRDGKYALEVCTQASIENAILKMVKNGLDINKNQCYFIPYGNELQLSVSYMGKEAIAKRVANVKEIKAFVVYEGDEFEYGFNQETFSMGVLRYKPSMKNVDNEKIVGCFGAAVFKDGSVGDVVYMTISQIQSAWAQGPSYSSGKSKAHKNFADEMSKKTVKNRIAKTLINTTDDADLINLIEQDEVTPQAEQKEMTASKEFVDVPFVEEPHQEAPKSQANQAPAQEKIECPI